MTFLVEVLNYFFQKHEYESELAEYIKRDPVNELPLEIIYQIFTSLNHSELTNCCLVSKDWHLIASDPQLWNTILQTHVCGKAILEKGFGVDVGEEPPLPSNLYKILREPCPLWKGKKVGQTHRLVLVPRLLNDVLNLVLAETNGMSKVENFPKIHFHTVHEIKEKPMELSSYWVLMTKELVDEEDQLIDYPSREAFLLNCNQKGNVEYRFPRLIEAIVWIMRDSITVRGFWENLFFPKLRDSYICVEQYEENKKTFQLWYHYTSQTHHIFSYSDLGKIIAVREL